MLTLNHAFEQLNQQSNDLREGTVTLLDPLSPTVLDHFVTILDVAIHFWGKLDLPTPNGSMTSMAIAFYSLKVRTSEYFQYANRVDAKDPKAIALRNLTCDILMRVILRMQKDEVLFNAILQNPHHKKCFADLCLLHACMAYEHVAAQCLASAPIEPEKIAQITQQILISRAAFKLSGRHHVPYSDQALQSNFDQLKKTLLRKLTIIDCLHNPNAMGFKELQFHIDRKNLLAAQKQSGFHGELIFNQDTFSQHHIDMMVLAKLVAKIQAIKHQTQPRTQFIVDVLGNGHAMLVDVGYNSTNQTVEILCVEPSCLGYQATFLEKLLVALTQADVTTRDVIAIQTNLLKDYNNCYTFSLALGSAISQVPFSRFQQQPLVAQPQLLCGDKITSLPATPEVTWRDVTALGKKIVMMGQSFTEMKINLRKLFPTMEEKIIDGYIRDLKASYSLNENVFALPDQESHTLSYIHSRRHSLRQRASDNPYADLQAEFILAKMKATSPGQALRRLAAGFGPSRELMYLLSEKPEVINEISETTGKSALHFAYENNKLGRAFHLQKAGADQEVLDKKLQKPRDLRH